MRVTGVLHNGVKKKLWPNVEFALTARNASY